MVHITYDYRKDRVSATHDRFASIPDTRSKIRHVLNLTKHMSKSEWIKQAFGAQGMTLLSI